MQERGFVVASARILKRAWQVYVAHVFIFVIFMAEIAYLTTSLENPLYSEEMRAFDFLQQPGVALDAGADAASSSRTSWTCCRSTSCCWLALPFVALAAAALAVGWR